MTLKKLIAAAAAAALTGCATPPAYQTLSGRPEATIQGKPRQQVMEALVNLSRANGETVKNVTDDSMTTEKQLGAFLQKTQHTPKFARREYQLKESQNTVRVICTAKTVTVFGGADGFEEVDTTQREGGKQCTKTLTDLQEKLK